MYGFAKTISSQDLDRSNIGRSISHKDQDAADLQKWTLLAQSERIAKRLETQGHKMTSNVWLSAVGLGSTMVEKTKEYRNSNLLPHIQSRNVHGMLQSLTYWLSQQKKNQCRMWVISNGFVPLVKYREHHMEFTRRMSKLANEDFMKEAGIEIIYYNVENTVKVCTETPIPWIDLNQHSHAIVRSSRKLGSKKWAELREKVRNYFPKKYMKDAGEIKKAAECVKYVFKPNDFELLNNRQLATLYEQTRGLRFYIPLGEFRNFRRDMVKNRLKLRKQRTDKGFDWVFVEINECPKRESSGSSDENQIVAITHPSPRFTSISEPCVIIRNMTWTPEELFEKVHWLAEKHRDAVLAIEKRKRETELQKTSVSSFSIWDTTTTSVSEHHWEPPPDVTGSYESWSH